MSEQSQQSPREIAQRLTSGLETPNGEPLHLGIVADGIERAINAERESLAAKDREIAEAHAQLAAHISQNFRDISIVCDALYDARQQIADLQEASRDEFKAGFTKATQDTLNLLWSDDPTQIFTAGPDGPGLVAAHFKQQRDALADRLRAAMVVVFGGMGKGSSIWGQSQWDKGWTAGIQAALLAFDTERRKAALASVDEQKQEPTK